LFSLALIVGSVAVLLLDALGSIALRDNAPAYARLAIVSHVIWTLVGSLGAWSLRSDFLLAVFGGALAGGVVGLVDATAGWWVSTKLGATPMTAGQTWSRRIGAVTPRVAARAAAFGTLGGLVSAIALRAI